MQNGRLLSRHHAHDGKLRPFPTAQVQRRACGRDGRPYDKV